MSRRLVENCEFRFKCPLMWESLTETGDEKVRFCGQCERKVYFCEDDGEFEKHARLGECVAVEKGETLYLGEPGGRAPYGKKRRLRIV